MEQEKNKEVLSGTSDADNVIPQDDAARKEWLKKRRIERRNKRNARIARGRFFKNLFIWILGVLFLPTAMLAATFIVPVGTFTGNNGEVFSQELEKKSLFEMIKFVAGNPGDLSFQDFPVISKSFDDLASTEIGDGKTLGDVIYVDTERLNAIRFDSSNLAGEIQSCIEVVATLESIGGTDMLGDFGHLSVFNEEEVAGTVAEIFGADEDAETKKQYYYKNGDGKYVRAFDNDGNPVSGITGSTVLYYPPLAQIKISEFVEIFGMSLGRTKVGSLLEVFGADNDELIEILGEETTVGDLGTFDVNNVRLNTILGDANISANNVLSALKEKDITVGEIGTALNNLSLYSVYGTHAFTTTPISGAKRFNKTTYNGKTCFEYSANGNYYLNNKAGIWLILCFDTATYNGDAVAERFADENGNPTKYIADELTIGDLQDGRSFSRKFKNATLKQFIETGLLDGSENLGNKTKAMSLQDIIEILASPQVQTYINSH